MGQLIDTSVIVNLERRNAPIEELLNVGGGDSVGIAAVSIAELIVGVLRASNDRERAETQVYLDGINEHVPVMPFDARAAGEYARLLVDLRRRGAMIGVHDLQIAATALSLGFAVLTDNPRDFERVPGLEVRMPGWQT